MERTGVGFVEATEGTNVARFENRDVSFDVPPEWEDRSVISFEAPRHGGQGIGPNITLMRLNVPPHASGDQPVSLQTFATQQVANLAASLPGFELVEQKPVTVSSLPAIQVLFHWQHPEGALTQRVTMFMRDRTMWSFAATGVRGNIEQSGPIFDRILASLVVHPVANPNAIPRSPRTS